MPTTQSPAKTGQRGRLGGAAHAERPKLEGR